MAASISRRVFWLVCLSICLSGCAAGFKTLALEDLSGPEGPIMTRKIALALSRQKGILMTEGHLAEVVLSGKVETRLEDVKGFDLVEGQKKTGREKKVTKKDPFVKRRFTVKERVYKSVIEEVPYVLRRASLTLTYSLLDEEGKVVQAPRTRVVRFSETYGGINENSRFGFELDDLPSRSKTFSILAGKMAEKLAARLAPPAFKPTLDKGRGIFGEPEIRRGVRLAKSGQWERAMEVWNKVLKEDPGHPAAHYNLGSAFERLGGRDNLEKARQMYGRAARQGHNPLYRRALTRVTVGLRELEKADSD